jgi:hypothetical protein
MFYYLIVSNYLLVSKSITKTMYTFSAIFPEKQKKNVFLCLLVKNMSVYVTLFTSAPIGPYRGGLYR